MIVEDQVKYNNLLFHLAVFLSGDISSKSMKFIIGLSNSGKSTLMEIVASMFGPFACKVSPTLFLSNHATKNENPHAHQAGMMPLEYARLVLVSELPINGELDAEKVSRFVGDELFSVRPLGASPIQIYNYCHFVVLCNNAPRIAGNDKDHQNMVGKIDCIELLRKFPRVSGFKESLDTQEFRNELFTLYVRYAKSYYTEGLPSTDTAHILGKYSTDPVSRFISDCLIASEMPDVPSVEVTNAFRWYSKTMCLNCCIDKLGAINRTDHSK